MLLLNYNCINLVIINNKKGDTYKKISISKGIMISGIIYALTLLLEVLIQGITLSSSNGDFVVMNIYLISLVIRPISLIVFIIFACKALTIILKACSILINEKKQS